MPVPKIELEMERLEGGPAVLTDRLISYALWFVGTGTERDEKDEEPGPG